jgi:hypothetical protein
MTLRNASPTPADGVAEPPAGRWIEEIAQPLLAWLLFTSWCFGLASFLGAFGVALIERLSVWVPPSLVFGGSLMYHERTGRRDLLRYSGRDWLVLILGLVLAASLLPYLILLPRLWQEAASRSPGLASNPLLLAPLMNPLFILRLLLAAAAWLLGQSVAGDLELIAQQRRPAPPAGLDSAAYYAWLTSPERWIDHEAGRQALLRKFLAGGLLLTLLAGLGMQRIGRFEIAGYLQVPLERVALPQESALVLGGNLLLYFLSGLLFLSLVTLTRRRAEWELQQVTFDRRAVERTWLRATGALLMLLAIIAVLLPYGLGEPLFTMAILAIGIIWQVYFYVASILMVLLALLLYPLSRLFTLTEPSGGPPSDLSSAPAAAQRGSADAILAVLLWLLIVVVLVWSAMLLARRPELVRAALRVPVLSVLVRGLLALSRWIAGLWELLARGMCRVVEEVGQRLAALVAGAVAQPTVLAPVLRFGPRFAVQAVYLLLLRQAASAGIVRRPSESAAEFSARLERMLEARAEIDRALAGLTSLFNEARYSAHPITAEHARQARAYLRRIREGIATLRRSGDT